MKFGIRIIDNKLARKNEFRENLLSGCPTLLKSVNKLLSYIRRFLSDSVEVRCTYKVST